MTHYKWMKIEQFHNTKRNVEACAEYDGTPLPTIGYRPKVKLHGTNAAIQIRPTGHVVAQGRKTVLEIGSDNYQFAAWVKSIESDLQHLIVEHKTVIHGEWFGKGIQKGVSCSQIGKKCFAVFAVEVSERC
jgi:hypothetical protein